MLQNIKHWKAATEYYLENWNSGSFNALWNYVRVQNAIVRWLKTRPSSSCAGSPMAHEPLSMMLIAAILAFLQNRHFPRALCHWSLKKTALQSKTKCRV